MSNFKVGDKVVCVNKFPFCHLEEGMIYEVLETCFEKDYIKINTLLKSGNYYPCNNFKLHQQNYDLNTQPWFIKVTNPAEYLAAKQWLIENGWTGRFVHGDNCPNWINQLSNVEIDLSVVDRTNWSQTNWFSDGNVPEIKLSFKTTIDKAEFPEVVLPSKKDKEIERIQNEMQKLQQDLEKLKGDK